MLQRKEIEDAKTIIDLRELLEYYDNGHNPTVTKF
jgi:hypothetical protein